MSGHSGPHRCAGFARAVQDLAVRAQRLTDASMDVHIAPRLPIVPRKVEDQLLRITQERCRTRSSMHARGWSR